MKNSSGGSNCNIRALVMERGASQASGQPLGCISKEEPRGFGTDGGKCGGVFQVREQHAPTQGAGTDRAPLQYCGGCLWRAVRKVK